MSTESESEVYRSCERAFLVEIAKTVVIVVGRSASLTQPEKSELASELTFAIAAHLSRSSFGGRVADDEIYPKVGFYKGETDDTLYLGEGCRLHELVPHVLQELSTTSNGSPAEPNAAG